MPACLHRAYHEPTCQQVTTALCSTISTVHVQHCMLSFNQALLLLLLVVVAVLLLLCVRYPDFTMTPSGLQYKDLREGTGETPQAGDTLVVDW